MQNLRDKFLKLGLVTQEAAKKAETTKSEPVRAAPPRPPARPPERSARPAFDRRPPAEVRLPKLPPLPGTKEANRLASKRALELDRTIRDRVLASQIAVEPGDTTFYFVTRKNRLRRLSLSAAQAKALEEGKLAVVERPDPDKIEHALVAPEVAVELLALSERTVRFLNREGGKVGFLTDDEIHARASEADAPDVDAPGADAAPEVDASSTSGSSGSSRASPPPDLSLSLRSSASAAVVQAVQAVQAQPAEPSAPAEPVKFITIKRG